MKHQRQQRRKRETPNAQGDGQRHHAGKRRPAGGVSFGGAVIRAGSEVVHDRAMGNGL
jgi:hypothetical protein